MSGCAEKTSARTCINITEDLIGSLCTITKRKCSRLTVQAANESPFEIDLTSYPFYAGTR